MRASRGGGALSAHAPWRPWRAGQLEDARFAVTGDGIVAVGGPRQLFRYCRDRIRRAEDPESRAWWQEVAGVLSQRALG